MTWTKTPPTEPGFYWIRVPTRPGHSPLKCVAERWYPPGDRPAIWLPTGDRPLDFDDAEVVRCGWEFWPERITDPDDEDLEPWTFTASATRTTRAEAVIDVTHLLDKWTAKCRAEFTHGSASENVS